MNEKNLQQDDRLGKALQRELKETTLSNDFADRLMERINGEERAQKSSHLWRRVAAIGLIAILISGLSYAGISRIVTGRQGIRHLKPAEVNPVNTISLAGYMKLCEAADAGNMSAETLDSLHPGLASLYSPACSWYCGGWYEEVKTTSCLPPIAGKTYDTDNLTDFNHETAWVEGAKGSGKGESITFVFAGRTWPVTQVNILNGYVKTEKAWRENNRVKQLKMYVDDKPYALLDLEDSRSEQVFLVDALGPCRPEMTEEEMEKLGNWTLKFEITDVYRGDKYDDTAISELFFHGPAWH
ncbi:MAG: hypothetical protein IJ196_00790 [Prevotella sp.]|nr:hypothetical protein [Prevotella sp.]